MKKFKKDQKKILPYWGIGGAKLPRIPLIFFKKNVFITHTGGFWPNEKIQKKTKNGFGILGQGAQKPLKNFCPNLKMFNLAPFLAKKPKKPKIFLAYWVMGPGKITGFPGEFAPI